MLRLQGGGPVGQEKVVFRLSSIVVGVFLVSSLLVGSAAAATVNQCNPPAYPTGAGFEVTCDVTVAPPVRPSGPELSTYVNLT